MLVSELNQIGEKLLHSSPQQILEDAEFYDRNYTFLPMNLSNV